MNTVVSTDFRDQTFKHLKTQHNNDKCIECQKKNVIWTSIDLGLFVCYECSGKHRGYGPVLSLVKGISLDDWNERQLTFMEQGGNKRMLDYLKKNGVNTQSVDWPNNQHVKNYKKQLLKQVEQVLRQKHPQQEQQQRVVQEEPKEQPSQPIQQQQQNSAQLNEEEQKEVELFNNNLSNAATKVKKSNVTFTKKNNGSNAKQGGKIKAEKAEFDWDALTFDDGVDDQKKPEIPKKQEVQEDQDYQNNDKKDQPWDDQWSQPKEPVFSTPTENDNKNLNKFKKENTKAISSDAFFQNNQQTSSQDKAKFSGFTSSQAISSDSFFDRETEQESQSNKFEDMKDFFWNMKDKASQKIQTVKENWKQ